LSEQSPLSEAEIRYQQVKKVTLIGAVVNGFLAFGKILLGNIGQSQALIADGVHSLADLVSDIIVVFAAKHGSRQADEDHPYGHGRIETVVEVLLGLMLIGVALGITIDSVARINNPDQLFSPTWFALLAAIVSIFANEALFQYSNFAGKKFKSNLLIANAWHHRTDAISSIIALIGIAGAMLGFPLLDAVAAIGVSLLISKVGWDISYRAFKELIDTALDAEKVEDIKSVIMSVDGVKAVHSLRTRSMGAYALVDVHILVVNSRISVSEGHQISETVLYRLLKEIDEVSDVTVHIDPEDDEESAPNKHLPLRKDVEAYLDTVFEKNIYYHQVEKSTLHYLNGKICIELVLPLSILNERESADKIADSFKKFEDPKDYIADVEIQFRS